MLYRNIPLSHTVVRSTKKGVLRKINRGIKNAHFVNYTWRHRTVRQ